MAQSNSSYMIHSVHNTFPENEEKKLTKLLLLEWYLSEKYKVLGRKTDVLMGPGNLSHFLYWFHDTLPGNKKKMKRLDVILDPGKLC